MQDKEPISNIEDEKKTELLEQDSAYIKETLLITSKEKTLKNKQYAILLNLVSHYIKTEYNIIKKYEGLNCKTPIIIHVSQKYSYKGNVYSIYWSNMGVSEMPTSFAKVQNRYALFQLRDEKPLSRNELPEILLTECTEEEKEKAILVINELSWVVLMCEKNTKHIVVKNIFSIEDEECIRYFNEFSCE